MVRNLTIAFLVFASLGRPAFAQQTALLDQRPLLRAHATVTGDVVRIGDLIENAGIVADIPIFRAPELGTTGSVSAAQVSDAVRPHAIIGLNTAGLSEVTVERAGRIIAAGEVQTLIAAALSAQFSLGSIDDISVSFDESMRGLRVDANVAATPRVTGLGFNPRTARFDATIEIAGSARRRLTGTATVTSPVVILSHGVSRGDVLKSADLITERRPRNEIAPDTITSLEQANGLAARNGLSAGRPLRNADLMKPEMVRRNESVTLIYEIPGVTLTLRGKASESGAEGDAIEVLNVQSKRLVQGIVTGPGRVLVTGAAPNVMAEAGTKSSSSRAPVRAQ